MERTLASSGCEDPFSTSGSAGYPDKGHWAIGAETGDEAGSLMGQKEGERGSAVLATDLEAVFTGETSIPLLLGTLRCVACMPDKASALSNLLFVSPDDRLAHCGFIQMVSGELVSLRDAKIFFV